MRLSPLHFVLGCGLWRECQDDYSVLLAPQEVFLALPFDKGVPQGVVVFRRTVRRRS